MGGPAGRRMTAQERQKAEQLLDGSARHKDTAAITQVDALQASVLAPGSMAVS